MTARGRKRADAPRTEGPRLHLRTDRVRLYHGDSSEAPLVIEPESIDAIVTDPPAGIAFMGRTWDEDKGGKDLPSGFGPWLAGLCDGEANFDIHRQRRSSGDYYYCRFEISLRADDGGMLEMLKSTLGGKVYAIGENGPAPSDSPGTNPKARWEMVSRDECARLVDIFDRFPLQSKKARDFAIWREALAVSSASPGKNRPDLMAPLWEQLRGTRPYAGRVTEPSVFVEMQNEHRWIAWLAGILRSAMALLKPGGHALVWALPRTSHWTARAVEDAGFEIRDKVFHLFGSGFPKSLDVSKAIDDAAGAERLVTGKARGHVPTAAGVHDDDSCQWQPVYDRRDRPATPAAAQWSGWGTALKPSVEEWILARKPLVGTVASNVQRFGTGAINVDGCRIGTADDLNGGAYSGDERERANRSASDATADASLTRLRRGIGEYMQPSGRWPAHLVLSHLPECEEIGAATEERKMFEPAGRAGNVYGAGLEGSRAVDPQRVARTIYRCAPGCAVAMLDEQSGTSNPKAEREGRRGGNGFGMFDDEASANASGVWPADPGGGASRFFATFPADATRFLYTPKAARSEKDAGLDHLPLRTGGEATDREDGSAGLSNPRAGAGRGGGVRNHHPTVKSIDLMRWLCRLITPPGGTVLDLFAGSGTTGLAALREGFRFVGIEREAAFVDVAAGRLAHVECAPVPDLADESTEKVERVQPSLFDARTA